jgi:cyclic beta-1,2-glucan synthetase
LYQTLSCRLWARTGFYQSGGAYGFRDQLQDTMALVHAEPASRASTCCARRAPVRGGRRAALVAPARRARRAHRFSDDYLWLPYATCRYVSATGDTGVLDEACPSWTAVPCGGRGVLLRPADRAEETARSTSTACAPRRGLRFGAHGLPLMGCGDWNDGMNLVGIRAAARASGWASSCTMC